MKNNDDLYKKLSDINDNLEKQLENTKKKEEEIYLNNRRVKNQAAATLIFFTVTGIVVTIISPDDYKVSLSALFLAAGALMLAYLSIFKN